MGEYKMKKQGNHQIAVEIKADKPILPEDKAGERILQIRLTAPPAPDDKPHIPLNLSLVIDRSGSMHGDKLHYVKQAAMHVVDLMTEKDRLAVVLYDNQVQTLMPSQFLTNEVKAELKAKLTEVQSGASTFLYGGWLAGCRHVAESVANDSFNRILLLTDGLANVGVRDIGALSVHAQELFTRGISTSCFGAGLDYDEHLLESMANNGGGSFHFLETLNAIPLVFEREFDEIISVTHKDIKITMDLPAGVKPSIFANWHTELEGQKFSIFLGNLLAEQTQNIYIKLENLRSNKKQQLEIPVVVTGIDQNQGQQELKSSIAFKPVPAGEETSAEPDQDLMERFAAVDLADKANEALKRERAGDRAGSSRLMMDTLRFHDKNISKPLRDKYENFTSGIRQGFDEAERKRHHYMEYQSRRGHRRIRHYPLSFENGALVAQIEGCKVLINTGSQRSIATKSEWVFLHELYHLKSQHNGLHIRDLSKTLGTRIDVILGMDILQDLFVRIEPQRPVITFNRNFFKAAGRVLDLVENYPTLSLRTTVNGRETLLRIVTGVGFSFLPDALLSKPAL